MRRKWQRVPRTRMPSSRSPPALTSALPICNFWLPTSGLPTRSRGPQPLERQLSRDTVVTVSYIWSRGLQLYGVRDLNVNEPTTNFTYTIQDADGNPTGAYTTPVYQLPRPDPRYGGIYQVQNGVEQLL